MTGGDSAAGGRRGRRWFVGLLVIALAAGGGASWHFGYAEEWWDRWGLDLGSAETPAEVAPPPLVDVPAVTYPSPVAVAPAPATLSRDAVERAVAGWFADRDTGRHQVASVAPLYGDGPGYERIEGQPFAIPASTTKIVTSAVALKVLGPSHRFTTRTTFDATGRVPQLTLVGGGDPYLTSERYQPGTGATFDLERASLEELADRTARQLRRRAVTRVRLGYDATLFTGPGGHPTWVEDPDLELGAYIEDEVIAPISALWADQGHGRRGWGRESEPPRAAAVIFADLLDERGIGVARVQPVNAAPAAEELVAVTSAPVSHVVQRLMEVSDNAAAEVLLRHIGLAVEGEGSFVGGEAGVRRTLAAHGIEMGDAVLYDGSGLSRASQVTPRLLVEVLRWVADPEEPALRPVLTGMPVGGFTGSLAGRMDEGPPEGLGAVRAKTGTLARVTALAGIVVTADDVPLAFVLIADRIPENKDRAAREATDVAVARLAACRCG